MMRDRSWGMICRFQALVSSGSPKSSTSYYPFMCRGCFIRCPAQRMYGRLAAARPILPKFEWSFHWQGDQHDASSLQTGDQGRRALIGSMGPKEPNVNEALPAWSEWPPLDDSRSRSRGTTMSDLNTICTCAEAL